MGVEISETYFDDTAFAEYQRRLTDETALLETLLAQKRFSTLGDVGGYELECWLLDHNYFPAPINQQLLDTLNDPMVVPELSRFNIEINGQPQALKGNALSSMIAELSNTWRRCQKAAHGLDSLLMMIGTLPTIRQKDLCLANMSSLKRYRALNEQVLNRRKGKPLRISITGNETLDITHSDVMLEAATTSFQIHLQTSQKNAVRSFNASLIAAAPILAAAGNSPYLFGADLWDETRIPLFEQSVDINANASEENRRVSFGQGYALESLHECFVENVLNHPVLIPLLTDSPVEHFTHLRLHNGTIWRWVRPLIGFDSDQTPHFRIEQRVLPAGPTIVDMLANAALYFGLVSFMTNLKEPLEQNISFEHTRLNFYAAAKDGLNATLTWIDGSEIDARTLLLDELLPMAKSGLSLLNINNNDIDAFLGILKARILSRQTGATWQRAYREKYRRYNAHLVAAYLEKQRSGAPVHEWDI
ncbi:MAG: glutamate--cysteine ligase [Methylococcaceae bacterium]|nr:glutamate--cysteine ligase [Methylococcaceae bacterium]